MVLSVRRKKCEVCKKALSRYNTGAQCFAHAHSGCESVNEIRVWLGLARKWNDYD